MIAKQGYDIPRMDRSREYHGFACVCGVLVAGDLLLDLQQERVQESHDPVHSQAHETHLDIWAMHDRYNRPYLPTGMGIRLPSDIDDGVPGTALHLQKERTMPVVGRSQAPSNGRQGPLRAQRGLLHGWWRYGHILQEEEREAPEESEGVIQMNSHTPNRSLILVEHSKDSR